jgi:hypothetical protein
LRALLGLLLGGGCRRAQARPQQAPVGLGVGVAVADADPAQAVDGHPVVGDGEVSVVTPEVDRVAGDVVQRVAGHEAGRAARVHKTLGVNDFYDGAPDWEFPLGHFQMLAKSDKNLLRVRRLRPPEPARIAVTMAGDAAARALVPHPATTAHIAAHAARHAEGAAAMAAERRWQAGWFARELDLA